MTKPIARPIAGATARPWFGRSLALLPVWLLTMASTCDQCAQPGDPRRGNVDTVSDVVVIDAADGHGYAISANPELLHLRVLDLTDGRFLTAPNRYFPLSIPVGSETRRLTVAVDATTQSVDSTRVFALDSADDTVFVVRTVDAEAAKAPFVVLAKIETGRAPRDVAAIRIDAAITLVAVTLPDAGVVQVFAVDNAGSATPLVDVTLPDGAVAGDITADPLGRAFIVGDALLPNVYAVEVDVAGTATVRTIDVGGPVSDLAAGIVDVGDGDAPVVLALRSDEPAAMLVRLFRPGFPEDRYALLGGTELPALGVAAYVPDARPSAAGVTVCCRGLDQARIDAGEATAAFAAVTLADGRILYLNLAASTIDTLTLEGDRRIVRLVDDDASPPGPPDGVDVNTNAELWVPAEGGDAFRPTVAFATIDNLGTPPFVPLVQASSTLLLTWEGELARARRLTGAYAPGVPGFIADAALAPRDVRVGDLARLTPANPRLDCDDHFDARILAVVDNTITVAFEGDASGATPAISDADSTGCLQGSGEVRLTVLAAGAFTVLDAQRSLGRLAFGTDGQDAGLELAGVRLTVAASQAGVPLAGSKLAIPLDPRVTTLGLAMTSLGTGALIPTAIAGGTVVIPDAGSDVADAVIPARRMVMSAASVDSQTGLPVLFTCDEAETVVTRVDEFN